MLTTSTYNTTANAVTLTGQAPFEVVTIWVNGQAYTPVWTTATTWSLTLPAEFGTYGWTIAARDGAGQAVGVDLPVMVENAAQPEAPAGNIVFNEIMYHPVTPGGEFVELFNRATNTTFNLSGWTVNGLGYTFPPGSILKPQSYLVLAKSRVVFATSYGGLTSVFDEFTGDLQADGETLSLIQPATSVNSNSPGQRTFLLKTQTGPDGLVLSGTDGPPGATHQLLASATLTTPATDWPVVAANTYDANGSFSLTNPVAAAENQFFRLRVFPADVIPATNDVIIDRVRYEPNAPWPTEPALIPGVSLQLVDAAQDNCRAANWSSSLVTQSTPGYANSVVGTLPEFPTLWLNEVQTENPAGPLDNAGEHDPWVELYNPGTNTISLDGYYLGTDYSSVTNWAFPATASIAPGQFLVVWLDGQPDQSNATALHTSFRLDAAGGAIALARLVAGSPQIVDYLNYLPLPANYSYGDFPDAQPFYRQTMFHTTPTETNNAIAVPITVSINEWMAENTSYLLDPGTGKYDDWFELFNPSDTAADLTGYYLTDTLGNPFQYQIPAGYQVPAHGFLLVWADGKTSANSTNSPQLHGPFKLSKDGEALGLFAPDGTAIDAVIFNPQTANISEGRYPDGDSLRFFMPVPSAAQPNVLP